MTSFRTRPKSSSFVELLSSETDPYSYFLTQMNARQFKQNLKDRGYDSSIVHPDFGHSLELRDWTMYGQYISGAARIRSNQFNPWYTVNYRNALPDLGTEYLYRGPFQGGVASPATYPGASTLPAFAQKAYARSAPTFEQFNLARSLAELRQLPRVKLDFLSKSIGEWRFQGDKWIQKGANRLGDDSLNVMFGWAPLVKDVIDLCKALVSITTGFIEEPVVTQPTHRTFKGRPEVTTHTESGTSYRAGYWKRTILTDPKLSRPGYDESTSDMHATDWTITKRLTKQQWFEGSFTKFLPIGFDAKDYLQKADLLLNLELTPLTLWNLAPWTWLSDWFVDISSTIAANQAASDKSLISHYAYAMETVTAEVFLDYTIQSNSMNNEWNSLNPRNGSFVTRTTWKRRIKANPFGFSPGGLSGLSPFQVAVLAALGLSRS